MKKLFLTSVAAALLTAWNVTASVVYQTPVGSSDSDGPVSAQATFSFYNGYMQIVLQDLQAGMQSQGQALSGISFDIAGITVSSIIGEKASGETIIVNQMTGGYTVVNMNDPLPHWGVAAGNGKITLATAGTGAAGGQPYDMIIGPPDANNKFPGLTGGFPNFNPYVLGSATFCLTNSIFNEATMISNLRFEFGTGPDKTIGGIVRPVPEPSTVIAGALLLLPFGFSAFRTLRKQRAVGKFEGVATAHQSGRESGFDLH